MSKHLSVLPAHLSAGLRRAVTLGAAILLAASAAVYIAPASLATPTCTTVGGFEIDGNMDAGTCGGTDWGNAPGVQSTTSIGTYNVVKDNSNPNGWSNGGGTPPKVDFERVYAFTQVDSGGHYDAYVGWERSQNSGTGGYAIEIDNAGTRVAADGAPQPDRSAGGFTFYITVHGSDAPVLGESCAFTSQATYPGTCTTSTAGYAAGINDATMHDPLANIDVPAFEFLEIGLDVTQLTGIAPSCPAPAAASLYVRSFTGQNIGPTGNLKGFVAPFEVAPNSTCVPAPITTTATPGNSTIDGLQVAPRDSDQHDVATVGTDAAPGLGTVKFFLCNPTQVANNANGDCATGGSEVTPADTLVAADAGQASSATINGSTAVKDHDPGKYCWRAEFTPNDTDHHYLANSHTNSTTECFTIAHATPTISTVSSATTTPGAIANSLGFTTLGDTATLKPVVSGASLTGQQITFALYGPFGSAPTSTSCVANKLVVGAGGSTNLTNVDATTWHASAPTYKPAADSGAGYYTWVASYAGDAINDAVSATGCGDPAETQNLLGASVSVAKGTPHSTITAGQDVIYDLNVQNAGEGTASNVTVVDVLPILPSGHKWTLDATPGYNCSIADVTTGPNAGHQVVTCTIGDLNPIGPTQIAELTATTTPLDCGTITNAASLTSLGGGSNTTPGVDVTVQCPALSIEKTADAPSVSVGSPIGFTVTVKNTGKGTATAVDIEDPLPTGPGIVWSIVTATGPLTCVTPIVGNTLSCTGNLPEGVSEVVHITSPTSWTGTGDNTVNSCKGGTEGSGTYDNTATVTATNVIGAPHANASEQVLCPDLHITKQQDADAVNAGAQIGFTIVATNTGDGAATKVVLTDVLPTGPANSGISWTIDTQDGPLVCDDPIVNNTLTCKGDLPAGSTETVHIVSDTSFTACATYNNTASLEAGNDPLAPSDTATTKVDCADLVIVKEADHDQPVDAGSDIGFTITVTNNGAGTANDVVVDDTLPSGPGIDWTIASESGPLTCVDPIVGNKLHCTALTMAPGAVETIHVTSTTQWTQDGEVVVNSCLGGENHDGVYDNTATETWSNGPADAISSEQATERVICPDLSITKSADNGIVSAGDDIGFSITVHNSAAEGTGTASHVMITDTLPTGVVWSPDTAGCTITTAQETGVQTLTCLVGDLAPDASATVHVTAQTSAASCATYPNTATVSATNEPGVESAEADVTVLCPDVTLAKTADADTVNAGDPIGFVVTASNSAAEGTGTAKDVAISDPLPTGPEGSGVLWHLAADQPENCSVSDPDAVTGVQTLTCSGVTLAPDESESVHVISDTSFTSCGTYDNTATLTLSNGTAPNPAEAIVEVQCSALAFTKTADAASVASGGQIGFTLDATNAGPGVAAAATLTDELPKGGGVSWKIDTATTTAAGCLVDDVAGTQVLTCALGDLAASASVTVHLVSSTSTVSCGDYPNTATLDAANAPELTATARTTVTCSGILPTSATPPPSHGVEPVTASTGAGPLGAEIAAVLALLGSGLLLLVLGRSSRRRGRHA